MSRVIWSAALWPAFLCFIPAGVAAGEMGIKPNAIVATDGIGQFKTVREAIDGAPQTTSSTNH